MSAAPAADRRLALYLVEPSPAVSDALASALEERVRTLVRYRCAESLLESTAALAPHRCLITELHLSGMNGIELMLALERKRCPTPTIITAIEANVRTAVDAVRRGAIDFIEKPFLLAELLAGLRRVESLSRGSVRTSVPGDSASP